MKAITVQQPWAWAIFHGKNIENRTRIGTWRPAVGHRIAVHAGLRWSQRGAESYQVQRAVVAADLGWEPTDVEMWSHQEEQEPGPRFIMGAVIGTVEVADVHEEWVDCDPEVCQPWGEASYLEAGGAKRIDVVHLVLENPVLVEPVPMAGRLGLWQLPADLPPLVPVR